jgi:hypothetical protein
VRVLVVGDVMDHGVQDQPYRPGEVQERGDLRTLQDRRGLPQIGHDHDRRGVVGEQGMGVHAHAGVVVHVHDTCRRIQCLRELVRVPHGRQPRSEVQELVNPLTGHEPDRPAEDRPVIPRPLAVVRQRLERLCRDRPVDREVVLATEDRVVHPGYARPGDVDLRRHVVRVRLRPVHFLVAHPRIIAIKRL